MNTHDNGGLKEPADDRSKLLLMYGLAGLAAAVVLLSMIYTLAVGLRMTARHTPQIDAAMEIKLEATRAHLWLEEVISGDKAEDMTEVWRLIDSADWYAQALLEGDESEEGKFLPLKDDQLRGSVQEIQGQLAEFRRITRLRHETPAESAIGSDIDQEYDKIYKQLMLKADAMETVFQNKITADLGRFRLVQIALIAMAAGLFITVAVVFDFFIRRHLRDEKQLHATNQQLQASEQQLRASNQQLTAGEQQLRAANQQLQASEQQLKGSNQQLVAGEQQLRATNQQLAAREREYRLLSRSLSVKNKELQGIVYAASHDLRSPLVNIQGFSGELDGHCRDLRRLLDTQDISDELRKEMISLVSRDIPEALEFISAGTEKMNTLLTGLLHVSRAGSVDIDVKELDMNELLASVIAATQFQIDDMKATATLEDLPPCLGDADQINQVFSNLVSNALKYSSADRAPAVRISGEVSDDSVVYCVEDNGLGIQDDHTENIFEIFHRLDPKNSPDGEGLGLTIVSRILDRHDGHIRVESEPGKGSRFFVSLPRA